MAAIDLVRKQDPKEEDPALEAARQLARQAWPHMSENFQNVWLYFKGRMDAQLVRIERLEERLANLERQYNAHPLVKKDA